MTPTLTTDGIVETWSPQPLPIVHSNGACPIAKCADVQYGDDLGLALVAERPVSSVRLLVIVQATSEDEEVAAPDPGQAGLRVCRKVRCALDPSNTALYNIRIAGLTGSVQWLLAGGARPTSTVVLHERPKV